MFQNTEVDVLKHGCRCSKTSISVFIAHNENIACNFRVACYLMAPRENDHTMSCKAAPSTCYPLVAVMHMIHFRYGLYSS